MGLDRVEDAWTKCFLLGRYVKSTSQMVFLAKYLANGKFACKNVLYTRSIHLLFPCVQCQSLKPV